MPQAARTYPRLHVDSRNSDRHQVHREFIFRFASPICTPECQRKVSCPKPTQCARTMAIYRHSLPYPSVFYIVITLPLENQQVL